MATFQDEDLARLRAALLRTVRSIDRRVPNGGLTTTQLSVLARVRREGPLGVGELAEAEGVNPTMLSRVVSKLEEAGHVRRASDENDRRAVVVEITAQGRRSHDRLRAERSKLLADRLERIDPALAAQLLDALPALEALADQMLREPVRVPS